MTPQLNALIKDYIDDFNKKQELPYVVKPSIPIVWFGDMAAYMKSAKKVVSVALNPSRKEFPANPRFNMVDLQAPDAVNSLEKTLNEYFKRNPYRLWFDHFENAISALGASYYEDRAENIALHIDIYSAIATDPTWGHLNEEQTKELARIDLFKKLFELLNPDVTLVSVGRDVFNEGFLPRFQLMCRAEKIGGRDGIFIRKYCRENQILIWGRNYRTPFGGMTYEVVRRTIQKMVSIESNPLGIGVSSCAMGNEENMTLKESLKGNNVNSENLNHSAAEGQRKLTDKSKLEFLEALCRAFEQNGMQGSVNENTKQFYPYGRRKLYFEIRKGQVILIFACRTRKSRNEIWASLGNAFKKVFSEKMGEIDYWTERNPQSTGARYIRFKYSNFPDVNNSELLNMMVQNYCDVYELLNRNGKLDQ